MGKKWLVTTYRLINHIFYPDYPGGGGGASSWPSTSHLSHLLHSIPPLAIWRGEMRKRGIIVRKLLGTSLFLNCSPSTAHSIPGFACVWHIIGIYKRNSSRVSSLWDDIPSRPRRQVHWESIQERARGTTMTSRNQLTDQQRITTCLSLCLSVYLSIRVGIRFCSRIITWPESEPVSCSSRQTLSYIDNFFCQLIPSATKSFACVSAFSPFRSAPNNI